MAKEFPDLTGDGKVTKKDILKGNKYRWNPNNKIWFKKVNLDELEHEKDWLTAAIYDQVFKGRVEEIIPSNKYKL